MARIRTIKPEMWTDERLTECSMSARLLFIGMLNFSDDNGNLTYSAKRLKMQIFPADSIDVQPMLEELLTHGLLIEYSVNGEKFLHIKGFTKHQVINRPSSSSIPPYPLTDDSRSTPRGKGMEGNGKEEEAKASLSPAKLPTCPTDSVIACYHEKLPTLPTVRLKSDTRTKAIGQFWKWVLTSKRTDGQPRATTADEALEWISAYFDRANENDFLMGRNAQTGKHANWTADFDFLLTEKGKRHVIEKTQEAA